MNTYSNVEQIALFRYSNYAIKEAITISYWNLHFILLPLCVAHSQIMNINTPYVNSAHVLCRAYMVRLCVAWICACVCAKSTDHLFLALFANYSTGLWIWRVLLFSSIYYYYCCYCYCYSTYVVLIIFHASRIKLFVEVFSFVYTLTHDCVWRSEFF